MNIGNKNHLENKTCLITVGEARQFIEAGGKATATAIGEHYFLKITTEKEEFIVSEKPFKPKQFNSDELLEVADMIGFKEMTVIVREL